LPSATRRCRLLALEDIEQAVAGNEAADDKKDPAAARRRGDKRRVNRGALPARLPHVAVTIAPEDTYCATASFSCTDR
jgi:hypothetical protein